jgi:hypothetical protein
MAHVGALPTVLDREGSPVAELRVLPARSTVAPPWRQRPQPEPKGETRPRPPLAGCRNRLGPMVRVYDPNHFLDRAVEYYMTGRFAALNNLQVAPNLFHHAVEMLAKFQLLRGVPDDRLAAEVEKYKQEPYGHNLHFLWSAFKADVAHSSLNRFDLVVADLNRWGKLRYGGFPVGIPTTMVFMVRRGPRKTKSVEPQDKYVLVLEDIDELFTAMVTASSLSPAFLGVRHRLKPALREWYAKDNLHPMADMFRTDPPAGN